jgi:hypothetical protein
MQWQTIKDAKKKDRLETQLLRPFIAAARDQVESEHVDSSGRNRMPI